MIFLLLAFASAALGGVFVFKIKRTDIPAAQEITLEELSEIWLVHNVKSATEANKDREEITEQAKFTESENKENEEPKKTLACDENIHENCERPIYEDLLKEISAVANRANDKGVYEVFSLDGAVYVHTSGLGRILKETWGLEDKDDLKEEVKKTGIKMKELGLSVGQFEKFRWTNDEGKKGKSLYLAFREENLPELGVKSFPGNIILMEKNDD